MYVHVWVVRCTVDAWRVKTTWEWDNPLQEWRRVRGTRFDAHEFAARALDVARGRVPEGASDVRVDRETILPSREHGTQERLPGVRSFSVLPGGAPRPQGRRPMEHGPFARP